MNWQGHKKEIFLNLTENVAMGSKEFVKKTKEVPVLRQEIIKL